MSRFAGYESGMGTTDATTDATSAKADAAIIVLGDDVGTAAQLVQRFGYDEAERIMLDSVDEHEPVATTVRRYAA